MNYFLTRTRLLGALLGTGLALPIAHAQAPTDPVAARTPSNAPASLTGQVSSAQGVVQPNAVVSILSLATSLRQTGLTNQQGIFTIGGLVGGGPYVVQVQQLGFRVQNITNVFLKAGEATALTVALNPETVAVGTRRDDRTVLESAVPVDVVNIDELVRTVPQTDLTQLLHYSVPAFNSTRQVASGGSDHVDMGNLRGLGTDQLLVLVNGKRRHTTALVNLLGTRGVGNVGTDINTLPSLGVERVEVLRDGAAAQYGSDAIAGVMNINLKSNNHSGSVLASSGVTSEGDGLATLLGLNKGFRLGEKGFLNLTADADYRDRTARGYSRDPRVTPVFSNNFEIEQKRLDSTGTTYDDFKQRNGDARVYNVRGLLNARVEASDVLAFYGFGGYNFRRGQAATPWVLRARQPSDIVDEYFPYGYQPQVNTRIHDGTGTVGVVLGRSGPNHWTLDLSNTTGYNKMSYDVENTLNPSKGASSATVFNNAGGFQYLQNVSNATVNRFFDKVLAGTNVAFGGEFRAERYEITAGEVDSYSEFDFGKLNADGGSQGFTGFGTSSAVVGNRTNVGAFLDLEADITKRWSVSGALRFENYSTFGNALIYKATTRLQVAKFLAVRGAINTGFRAPSLQQVLYRQITQRPGATGVISAGIFNSQNRITQTVGIDELKAENSTSYSAGLVLTPASSFSLTADAYQIDIDKRITLSGLLRPSTFPFTNNQLIQDFSNEFVTQAQFFTNLLNTRTQGIDVVASYRQTLGTGRMNASAAANLNRTKITKQNTPPRFLPLETDASPITSFADPRQISLIETGSPASKILLDLNYTRGKVGVGVRNTYFGKVSYYDNAPDPTVYDFGGYLLVFKPRTVTDLLVSVQATKALALTLGTQNMFNIKPNTIDEAASNGTPPVGTGFTNRAAFETYFQNRFGYASPFPTNRDVYPYAPVQMGYNGTFLYLKAVYSLGI